MSRISISVGATKVPCAAAAGSCSCSTRQPASRIASTWRSMFCCASRVITGPMSVASRSGLPTASSCIAPRSMSSTRSAMSSCRHSTRSAEQRWPALSKAEASTSLTTCSGSADESTIIAFWPPVSAISGTARPSGARRVASWRWISRATSVEPVNSTPQQRGSATSAAPTSPAPGRNCSAPAGTPASCSSSTAAAAISGVSSAGLASTALPAASAAATWPVKIASGKFQGVMQTTGPSGRWPSPCRLARAWARVVAQEVDGFANLRDRVGQRLAGLAHDEPEQLGAARLEELRGPRQHCGALGRRRGRPGRRGELGLGAGGFDVGGARLRDRADEVAVVGGIAHRPRHARPLAGAGARRCGDQRHGPPGPVDAGSKAGRELGELLLAREVEPGRVASLGAEQLGRQRDLRVRRANRDLAPHDRDRVLDQLIDRHLGIGDPIDEGGVGAILEQAAHQVGEQGLVGADRRVDAAGPAQLVLADDLLVERLAHAVQALELVLAGVEIAARHLHDGGERVRVVGRELREDRVRRGEQPSRAGEVGDVGVHLARVDREVLEPVDLGALDLAVPVGALDEADHESVLRAPRQVDDPVDHVGAALLVGLHHEADAVPALELRVEAQCLEQVERDLEPVGLLGVDVERDVVAAREHGELGQARQQLGSARACAASASSAGAAPRA